MSGQNNLRLTAGVVIALSCLPAWGLMDRGHEPVRVGVGRRQVFLDDYLIGEMTGLKRVPHQPKRDARNPILVGEHPWEQSVEMPSALYEPPPPGPPLAGGETGGVRLWYRATHRAGELDFRETDADPEKRKQQLAKLVGSTVCQIAYAESKDGVKFHKPTLKLIDFRGSKDNNLVWGRMGDWANMVVKFPDEQDPARRYKCMIWAHQDFGGYYGNIGLFSPDGLHWTMSPRPTAKLDHAYNYWYDPARREYLALIQYKTTPRTVGRMVSSDFINWRDRREVLVPDDRDPPGTEFYVPTMAMLDDLYLCFLHIFHTDPKEDGATARQHGTIDIQLATSRDGIRWERALDRQVFLPLGAKGAFDDSMVFYVGPPVEFQDQLVFYYCGYNGEHGTVNRKSAIGRATMRPDGYVSLEPTKDEGHLITKPFKLGGTALEINTDASRGAIRVAILDAAGNPISGFDLSDAVPVTKDGLRLPATWKDRADLSALQGKVVRLKFHVRKAALYGFVVKP